MPVYLLIVTVIMIACIICNKLSCKLGIPTLLAFILLGMFFGSDGVVKIPFDDYVNAEQICSFALIFIMFYGGFGTKWSEAKPVAKRAMILSTFGVFMTAMLTGLFCHIILNLAWMESLLIGSVVSSTDAASVFSILRCKRLNLRYNTASLLEVESGSNDPTSYMLTVIILSLMQGNASVGHFAYLLFAQIVYGVLFGVLIAYLTKLVLTRYHFSTPGFDAIFVLAIAMLAYAVPTIFFGNGYLSTYIVGIILGNCPIKNKESLVHFFDGITGLLQMVIFFLLGLLSFPSKLPTVIPLALAIALFMTLIARPLTITFFLYEWKTILIQKKRERIRTKWNQIALVSLAGLRGASSIVFAIMVTTSEAIVKNDVFHIVFCIVLFSILVQGTLLPIASHRWNMIDDKADVFKTFNDYVEEVPVQFIQFTMNQSHGWCQHPIKEILLPPDTLIVYLQRQEENIVPNGDTVLEEGDRLVLSAKVLEGAEGMKLSEIIIHKEHEWIGKLVSELSMASDKLIIMIQRAEELVIPNGRTVVMEGDILVINEVEVYQGELHVCEQTIE